MYKIYLILAFSLAFSAMGQIKTTLYFNDKLELTAADKATSKREAVIEKDVTFDGPFQDYTNDGVLIEEGSYTKGIKSGINKTYKDGKLESEILYTDQGFIVFELIDKNGDSKVSGGTGFFSIPYQGIDDFFEINKRVDGMVSGQVENRKPIGKWTYLINGKKQGYEETYENGIMVKRVVLSKGINYVQGKVDINLSSRDYEIEKFNFDKDLFKNLQGYFELYPISGLDSIQRNITYPGGISKLSKLIVDNLSFPVEDRRARRGGTTIVRMTVDEHGNVKNLRPIKSVSPTMDAEALRLVRMFEHKLCPAVLNGRFYESILSIPITFNLAAYP